MAIVSDGGIFDPIAREFVIRYVEKIARMLDQQARVDFDLTNITEEAMTLLFELCFCGVAAFEDQSGFQGGGKTFTPRAAFEADKDSDPPTILVGHTLLHGLIEDDVLLAGIERARRR